VCRFQKLLLKGLQEHLCPSCCAWGCTNLRSDHSWRHNVGLGGWRNSLRGRRSNSHEKVKIAWRQWLRVRKSSLCADRLCETLLRTGRMHQCVWLLFWIAKILQWNKQAKRQVLKDFRLIFMTWVTVLIEHRLHIYIYIYMYIYRSTF
jgi:hypothetical protein